MIDVSRFRTGDRCPRCSGRRVYAVDIPNDRWRCVPYAMPFALEFKQHDATASADDVEEAIALQIAAQEALGGTTGDSTPERQDQPCEAGRTRRSSSWTSAHTGALVPTRAYNRNVR